MQMTYTGHIRSDSTEQTFNNNKTKIKMKKIFYLAALAVVAAACTEKTEGPEVIIEETVYEGSGNLQYFGEEGAFDTNHTYTWKCEGTSINIDIEIDLDQYRDAEYEGYSSWQLGSFTLPQGSVSEFLGTFVNQLDETTFVSVNTTDGTEFAMNSYKPGVWLDENGDEGYCSCVCWQWYVWEGKTDIDGNTIGYDYSAEEYPGLFYVVAAPGSIDYCAGKKVVSTNYIVVDGQTYDFIVTFDLKGTAVEAPKDESESVTAAKGEAFLTALDMTTVYETSKLAWDCSAEGFNFEATISVSEAGENWGIGYVKFDYSVFNDIIGEDICNTTLENFYPLNPDGTPVIKVAEDGTESKVWNSYAPGEWISLEGMPANWGDIPNHSFWQLHAYADTQGQYYDIKVPGALIIGQCPGVPVAGDVAVSKAVIKDIPWTVTFKYVE